MTKEQVTAVITNFKNGYYSPEYAIEKGIDCKEFIDLFTAFRAVDGKNIKIRFVKTPMMQYLYREKGFCIKDIMELFGVSQGYAINVCWNYSEFLRGTQ